VRVRRAAGAAAIGPLGEMGAGGLGARGQCCVPELSMVWYHRAGEADMLTQVALEISDRDRDTCDQRAPSWLTGAHFAKMLMSLLAGTKDGAKDASIAGMAVRAGSTQAPVSKRHGTLLEMCRGSLVPTSRAPKKKPCTMEPRFASMFAHTKPTGGSTEQTPVLHHVALQEGSSRTKQITGKTKAPLPCAGGCRTEMNGVYHGEG
jgi:hypothetical protein